MQTDSFAPNYASLGRRFAAWFLDLMILAIPCAIASEVVPVAGGLIILFFYSPILEASDIRATLGKHLMGIQVSDLMGRRISFKAAMIRNALKFVSSILLFIGFFFALFTQRKQALHDLLADTLVVYGRSERNVTDAWSASIREVFNTNPFDGSSTLSQLERLQALRSQGAITEEEFQAQKKRILET